MDPKMKKLAKKRAAKDDVKVEAAPTFFSQDYSSPEEVHEVERDVERRRAMAPKNDFPVPPKMQPDDVEIDHASKLKRKKFSMMKSLLSDMDAMDK